MNPRQGPLGRQFHLRETSWASDPVTPVMHLMPLHAQEQFKLTQPRNQAVVYEGTFASKGSYKGPIDASGDREMSMDFHYIGYDLMDIMGSSGYTRSGGLHKWTSMGLPLPYQLQKEYTQATAIIHRYPGIYSSMMKFAGASSGQQMYTMSMLGKGSEARAAIGGATTSDQLQRKGFSYFDGSITKDDVILANVASYDFTLDRKMTGKEGFFAAGQRSAVSIGTPLVSGHLGLIFSTDDGDTFYDQGINDTIVSLSCLLGNKPLTAGPDMFMRWINNAVLFSRAEPGVGGDTIPDQVQEYVAQVPAGYYPGHAYGTLLGPFTLTGANNVFSGKFQGGSTINVTLGTGSLTAAAIAAVLNADVTFNVAGKAYDLNGRLEIRSLNVTSASSFQWQTGTANSAHTVLGFDTTTWVAYAPAEHYVEVFNDLTADYI